MQLQFAVQPAMEEAAAAGEGSCEHSPPFSSSTTWTVGEGSLKDSIFFETSTTPDSDDAPLSDHLLLLRPPPTDVDSPPCEITVYFTGKHEIHRVYIRSTARVYEIYYASDNQKSNMEYLCTVRCGAALKETSLPDVNEADSTECQGSNKGTAVEHEVTNGSNNCDEDGWVQVKLPDSLLQDERANTRSKRSGISSPKTQTHYEATAEISDFSPCISLTLRLLSIQTKDCVHVEEIYICADPVESASEDPPTNMGDNLGGSSLFSALLPSLLQISKSGTNRMQSKYFSNESDTPKYLNNSESTTRAKSLDMGETVAQDTFSCISRDEKLEPVQVPTKEKLEETQVGSSKKVTDPNRATCPMDENNNLSCNRLEKVLDELVSRVGRVEAFCSRFEESVVKPLGCIEMRLQRLEKQLDAFTVRSQSSERFPCSRISAPEFICDDSDSENKGCSTNCMETREDTVLDTSSPADEATSSVPEPQENPGLVVKAPEFPSEEDECTNAADTSDSFVRENFPKNMKSISIDGALASALQAFLKTSVKSPNLTPSLMEIPQEFNTGGNNTLDSSISIAPSEGDGCFHNKSIIEDNGFGLLEEIRDGSFSVDLLPPDDTAAPESNFNESDMKKDCDTSDAVRHATSFSSSPMVADCDVASHSFTSQLDTRMMVMTSEFRNKDGSTDCDCTSSSATGSCLKDPASAATISESVPPLALFLSAKMLQPPLSSSTLISVPTLLSNVDGNVLGASIVEGADESGIKNPEENEKEDIVDLEPPTQNALPSRVRLEQKDYDNGKYKCSDVDLEASRGGVTSRSMLDEGILEQNDHNDVKWNALHSVKTAEEQHLAQNKLHHSPGIGLTGNGNQEFHDGGLIGNNDPKQAVTHGLNRIGRGTEDNSSQSSSFDENFIKTVQIDRSDGGNSYYPGRAFTIINYSKSLSDKSETVMASAAESSTIYHNGFMTGSCQSSAGCNQEKSNVEVERASPSTTLDSDDLIYDVKFSPEKNWVSGLSLEALLGEVPDAEVHNIATNDDDDDDDDDDDGIDSGKQQYSLSSSQFIGQKAGAVGGLLLDVDDLSFLTEASSSGGDATLQIPANSANPQLISGLI